MKINTIFKLEKMNNYQPVSTCDPEADLALETANQPNQNTMKMYKIFVGEKLRNLHINVGIFTDKKEASKVYMETVEKITAFCKENSDRTDVYKEGKFNHLSEKKYHNDKYAGMRPFIINENYYQTTWTTVLAYNKGIFYGENIVLDYYIYNTEISIPLGQFTTEFYPQMPEKD